MIQTPKINMGIGDPLFYQEQWKESGLRSDYPIYKNMRYFLEGFTKIRGAIVDYHKNLSKHWSPVDPASYDGDIVQGCGSTQLVIGTLISIWIIEKLTEPCYVLVNNPHYAFYQYLINAASPGRFILICDLSQLPVNAFLIELVTSPNNPDGVITSKRTTSAKYTLYDRVYDLPSFGIKPQTVTDDDVSFFTTSKAMGFASSRVGWALFRSPQLAAAVRNYVSESTLGLSAPGMELVLTGFQYVNCNFDRFYSFARAKMEKRWKQYIRTVQKYNGEKCKYGIHSKQRPNGHRACGQIPRDLQSLKRLEDPNERIVSLNKFGAYSWLQTPGRDAFKVFSVMGILGTPGTGFLMSCQPIPSNEYLRLNFMCDDETWHQFITVLKKTK